MVVKAESSGYVSDLSHVIEHKILANIAPGEIRRRRLQSGLALAYTENQTGILSLSRLAPAWPSSADEVNILTHDFIDAAARIGQQVVRIKEIERVTVQLGHDKHCVVRLAVYFGKQGRLL